MFFKKFLKKIMLQVGYEIHRKRIIHITSDDSNSKYQGELEFWIERYNAEHHTFQNGHYEKIMLGMSQELNDSFLKDKIVVDFGCGPRGSLVWTTAPKLRIGVDVLVDKYFDFFGDEMINDNYIYIKSTEKHIPIPTEFADVVYTMNSMDHTDNFEAMLSEIFRILKTGGEFIGSFNMNEPATETEPQTLTFEMIEKIFSQKLQIQHKLTAFKGDSLKPKRGTYDCFFDKNIKLPSEKDICILWIRGKKRV
jgi:SAM-dependent methyltransferase